MKYIKSFELYESINEGKSYDVPEFGHFSVNGKKLTVEFYNLDDWDSSMYGGGKGKGQALKDIKMAAKGENDPLLDDIEIHLDNGGLGSINWDKPIKVKDAGSSLEFMLESEKVDEGFLAIAGGIILAVLGLKVLKKIAKAVLRSIGKNVKFEPKKLNEVVDKIYNETIKEGGISGKDLLALTQWKQTLTNKINSGEITTIKGITAHIDATADSVFEDEEINEGSYEDFISMHGQQIKKLLNDYKKISKDAKDGKIPEDKIQTAFEFIEGIYDKEAAGIIDDLIFGRPGSMDLRDIAQIAIQMQNRTGTEMQMIIQALEDFKMKVRI